MVVFLGLGLLIVVIFWYIIKGYEDIHTRRQREYLRRPRGSIITPLNQNNINHQTKDIKLTSPFMRCLGKPVNSTRKLHNHPLNIVSIDSRVRR